MPLIRLDRDGEAKPLVAARLPVLVDRWGNGAEITQRAYRALTGLEN